MKQFIISAALAAAALVPALSHAAADDTPSSISVHPAFGFMGTFGGDKLAGVQYTDGKTAAVTAGGIVYLYGGVQLRSADLPVSLLATVGYHKGIAGGDNGDFTFERVPLELLAMVDVIPGKLRLGGGVRHDTNVNLSAHGVVQGSALKFEDATGGVIQAEWMLGNSFSIVGRYVAIKYRYNADGGVQYRANANQGGIGVNWYL